MRTSRSPPLPLPLLPRSACTARHPSSRPPVAPEAAISNTLPDAIGAWQSRWTPISILILRVPVFLVHRKCARTGRTAGSSWPRTRSWLLRWGGPRRRSTPQGSASCPTASTAMSAFSSPTSPRPTLSSGAWWLAALFQARSLLLARAPTTNHRGSTRCTRARALLGGCSQTVLGAASAASTLAHTPLTPGECRCGHNELTRRPVPLLGSCS